MNNDNSDMIQTSSYRTSVYSDETFSELIVERVPRPLDALLKALLIVALVVSAAATLLLGPVFLVVFIVLAFLTYYLWPRFKVEYEYSYVNGQIDVARVFSKQSRKDVAKIDTNDVECIAPLGSHQLDSYGSTYKEIDYSSGNPEMKTYVLVKGGQNPGRILLHLDDRMLSDLRRRLPRKVFTD